MKLKVSAELFMTFLINRPPLLSGSEDIMDYIKINDSENAIFDENGNLQIDGASYVEGLDDYEWFFQIEKKYINDLYKAISGINTDDNQSNSLIDFLIKNKIKVSELVEVCQKNNIEHYFTTYR